MAMKESLDQLENYKNTGVLDVQGLSVNGTTMMTNTAGTATASQMVILDANKALDNVKTAKLSLGTSGSEVDVTSTAAEINQLHSVSMANAAQSTISAAAGASNVATVTVQLKDAAGNNLAHVQAFKVYASSAADGLTLASAASTGFSVASGGIELPNENSSVTQGISCVSSATGGCVLSLTDSGKATSYLVLVLPNGIKISAQLSSGSYGA